MKKEGIAVYILKKGLRFISLLLAITFITFWLMSLSPIDPIQAYVGAQIMLVGPEQRQQIAEYWGLDQPLIERFKHWAGAVARGDWGTSMIYRQPVLQVIQERFTASLVLMGTAWLLSGILGFSLGVIAGMKRGTWIDEFIKGYCYTLSCAPAFWVGLLMLIVFSVWLGWFPIGLGVPAGVLAGEVTLAQRLYHLCLPALTLSITGVASVALHTREKLIEVLNSDYVLFARARGEKGLTLLFRHGIRNIALPAITLQFSSLGEIFGGSVLTEQVFSYPGTWAGYGGSRAQRRFAHAHCHSPL